MKCPHYELCKGWYGAKVHPGGEKFQILEKLGTCSSLEFGQCMYLFKMYNPRIPVLIVEDEDAIRENLVLMVQNLYGDSAVAFPANSYFAGYQMVQKRYFPLALLDVRLGDGSGIQLLEDIKRESSPTTVVMITAFDKFTELIQHAKDKGAAECLGKPFTFEQIKNLLDKYLIPIRDRYQRI